MNQPHDITAFPVCPDKSYDYGFNEGMTLRDYFAGKALALFNSEDWGGTDDDQIAKNCYGVADAMLKERVKQR